MSPNTDQLVEDVRRSLQDHAGQVVVSSEPFDPNRPGVGLEPTAERGGRGRRPVVVLAIAAVACLVLGVAVVVRSRTDDRTALDTTAPPAPAVQPWWTPRGSEVEAPAVPDGWTVYDYGDVRFAAPADWQIVKPGRCPPDAQGVAGLIGLDAYNDVEPACPNAGPSSTSTLTINIPAPDAPRPTMPAMREVGTFGARGEASDCPGCTAEWTLDNGYTVSITGPLTEQVLATFTDSGRVRTVQAGPVADTTGWRTVNYEGISFKVPADWPTISLGPTDPATPDTGRPNPGSCGNALFASEPPAVWTDTSSVMVRCPYAGNTDLRPGNGIWIRDLADVGLVLNNPIETTTIGSLKITMAYLDDTAPAIDLLVVRQPSGPQFEITLGAGLDASITRAILASITG